VAGATTAVNAADLLANGVQDITNHMVADGCKLNEVLHMILETMYRALGFRVSCSACATPGPMR